MVQRLSRAVAGGARGGAIACALLAVGCLALGGVFVRLSEAGPIATGGFRSLIAAPMLLLLDAGIGLRSGPRARERMPLRDHVTIALGGRSPGDRPVPVEHVVLLHHAGRVQPPG